MFTSYDFMVLGLDTAQYYKWRKYNLLPNIDRFRRDYGAHPATCEAIWNDLQSSTDPEIHVDKKGKPLHFLLALRWLYKYHTEEDLGKFFRMTEKTVGKWTKHYAEKICLLLESKVRTDGLCCPSSTMMLTFLFLERSQIGRMQMLA